MTIARTLLAIAAVPLLAAPLLAAPALAAERCTPTGGETKPIEAVTALLQEKGYRDIRKLEMEDGCYEAKAFDAQGKRVEVYVHPNTGEIVKVKGGRS